MPLKWIVSKELSLYFLLAIFLLFIFFYIKVKVLLYFYYRLAHASFSFFDKFFLIISFHIIFGIKLQTLVQNILDQLSKMIFKGLLIKQSF